MRVMVKAICLAVAMAVCGASVGVGAQAPAAAKTAPAKTASQFYVEYRAAFDKAKKIEDLFPYMDADTIKQAKAEPADKRTMLFSMMKELNALTNLKIVKETATPKGATLMVEGLGPDKAKMKGTIEIVKEAGAMKVGKEQWSN